MSPDREEGWIFFYTYTITQCSHLSILSDSFISLIKVKELSRKRKRRRGWCSCGVVVGRERGIFTVSLSVFMKVTASGCHCNRSNLNKPPHPNTITPPTQFNRNRFTKRGDSRSQHYIIHGRLHHKKKAALIAQNIVTKWKWKILGSQRYEY